MAHKKGASALLLLVVLLSVAVCGAFAGGCKTKESVITGISVANDYHKSQYNLDEPLDKSGELVLTMLKGDTRRVSMQEATVTGFDSGLTGTRTMTFNYQGHKTEWQYTVSYKLPTLPSEDVTTHTRFESEVEGDTLIIRMKNVDVPLYGIDFLLDYERDPAPQFLCDPAYLELGPSGSTGMLYPEYDGYYHVILLTKNPYSQDMEVLRVKGGNRRSALILLPKVSDGQTDFFAPSYQPAD